MKINFRSIIVGVIFLAILVGGIFFLKMKKAQKPVEVSRGIPLPAGAMIYRAPEKARGPSNAPVKLLEYSDFECPACRGVQDVVNELFKKYPGKIQLTFKHYPLQNHRWSMYAHQAAECMSVQGKFWAYHDKLYTKQQEWAVSLTPPVETFIKYAQEIGADMDRLGACLSDVAVTREIYAEKEQGTAVQVSATPTFFLGKERFVGPKEMKERAENAVRAVLGLPPISVPVNQKPAESQAANAAKTGI